jgi:hypothetical protein
MLDPPTMRYSVSPVSLQQLKQGGRTPSVMTTPFQPRTVRI